MTLAKKTKNKAIEFLSDYIKEIENDDDVLMVFWYFTGILHEIGALEPHQMLMTPAMVCFRVKLYKMGNKIWNAVMKYLDNKGKEFKTNEQQWRGLINDLSQKN